MTAGSLVTGNWEAEFAGIGFGGEHSLQLSRVAGLMDLPDLSGNDQKILFQHGTSPGVDQIGARTIEWTVEIEADSQAEFASLVSDLVRASTPYVGGSDGIPLYTSTTLFPSRALYPSGTSDRSGAEIPLVFQFPGVNDGAKSVILVRPRRRSLPVDWNFYHRNTKAELQFLAADPRIYSYALKTASIGTAEASGGLTFDAVAPFEFGAGNSGGSFVAENEGTFAAPVVFRLDGPLVNPRIENLTWDLSIDLNLTVNAGEFLIVDTRTKAVLLNGTASRYGSLSSTSRWFSLAPGVNEIALRTSSPSVGTMTAEWRDTSI